MSLKPESLRPKEIANLDPKLSDAEPTESLIIVHAAIEELQATADQVAGPLRDQQRMLEAGDDEGLIQLVTDLREMFDHLGGHCDEATRALWQLTDTLSGQQASNRAEK